MSRSIVERFIVDGKVFKHAIDNQTGDIYLTDMTNKPLLVYDNHGRVADIEDQLVGFFRRTKDGWVYEATNGAVAEFKEPLFDAASVITEVSRRYIETTINHSTATIAPATAA